MECSQIDLYEFLTESELQQYYNAMKNELKITNAAQFKYATDEDLKNIGLSRPEIRRLRKFYEKHFPHGYLSKIKRLLQTPTALVKREDGTSTLLTSPGQSLDSPSASKAAGSPNKVPNNKHIIPADCISVNKQLGTGEFGIVQQGVWTNGNERIQVAIKCLCRERMQSNPMEFLKEAAIMHSIEHENIVRLYGVVLATDSLMLVTELAHLRSLLECLKDPGLRVSFLTIPTLCEFAMQICNGMSYLENKRLIHRDLAARNILVFSKNKVKISDFGLSRALGVGKDYYKTNFNVNLKLPIAWCAPECINYLRFTNASDVWAYGVCLWEMFSYGFQPWAALTGLQILEAIDAPNFQRLEQPDCCPREYYTLMLRCWQDDPAKRPKFSEIYELLPDIKPEQLKAVANWCESKKDHLVYRQGDIITVLDRNTGASFWKGVLGSGQTGYFNPSNTVAYLESLPTYNRDSFCRVSERSSKRKLRTEMISKPQNDFKHTGHVGIDGDSFGDIAFLGNSQTYNHVPRQIVTPYKPSEDIEQTPLLLPPTPTSPDSLQTASGYFPDGATPTPVNALLMSSSENTPRHFSSIRQSFEYPGHPSTIANEVGASTNPFEMGLSDNLFFDQSCYYGKENSVVGTDNNTIAKQQYLRDPNNFGGHHADDQHEYHEISDDEMTADKLDLGPSLLDEINSMFGSMTTAISQPKSPDFEQTNKKNEFTEISSKFNRKNCLGDANGIKFSSLSSKKKTAGTVKPISVKDEKILNHAIEIANEISARSMNDLVAEQPGTAQSPKRKFSFRFPHLSNNGTSEKNNSSNAMAGGTNSPQFGTLSPHSKKKNFTDELKSIPDLQAIIGVEGREAYNNLIERKSVMSVNLGLSPAANLLRHLDTNEFEQMTAKTLPRRSVNFNKENHFAHEELSCKYDKEQGNRQISRPMTLPNRGATKRWRDSGLDEVSPQPDSNNGAGVKSAADISGPVIDGVIKSEQPHRINAESNVEELAANPIPLPPREGKKHIKANPKRHVRKYPLIIPANGLQRTLNKVTEQTVPFGELNSNACNQNGNDPSMPHLQMVASMRLNSSVVAPNDSSSAHLNDKTHTYENIGKSSKEICLDSASLQFESILEADFGLGNVLQSPDVTDGFYNFSIQKEQYNKSKEVDYDTNKISGLYVNEDELRNLDIERNAKPTTRTSSPLPKPDRSSMRESINLQGSNANTNPNEKEDVKAQEKTSVKTATAKNELADNALFRKVRESVDTAMSKKCSTPQKDVRIGALPKTVQQQTEAEYFAATATRLANSNSVSCEDLLEFSDKKPKGCERGVDSDEVRIMTKVLGKDSTPERCLDVLEFINWDVHKAIKVIKLQNIFLAEALNLTQAVENLQQYEWDLHTTAIKLKGFKT